jgi:hypothetical protein
MARVLVVGGTLFIGRALVARLLTRGDEVWIMHRSEGTPFGERVREIRCDRNDGAAVEAALAGHAFEVVYDNVYDFERGTPAEPVAAAARARPPGLRHRRAVGAGAEHRARGALGSGIPPRCRRSRWGAPAPRPTRRSPRRPSRSRWGWPTWWSPAAPRVADRRPDPLLRRRCATRWCAPPRPARSPTGCGLRRDPAAHLAPIAPAIAEPTTGLTMGESAEKMAQENGISREEQDRWALRSHQLAAAATEDGRLTREIAPVLRAEVRRGGHRDNGIRADTSLEKLSTAQARLRPQVRHGDRRQRLAAHRRRLRGAADERGEGEGAGLRAARLHPLVRLRRARPGDQLLQGPVYAAPSRFERAGLTMKDIDLLEMHEAFAAQVLSNLQWFDFRPIAKERLGRDKAIGLPPRTAST